MATETEGHPPKRLRAGLRRHGLVRRPPVLRAYLHARGLRFSDGNRLTLYNSGATGLAAMLEAIEAARSRIHLETYILRSDRTGRRFLDALGARARRGVVVRLLYDAFGSIGLDTRVLADLRRLGADVLPFNPLRRLYPRWFPRRRDHRKLLTVDGEVGFIGGLNIGNEYDAGPEAGAAGWRDTHVRVEGPAVRDLEAVFLESWFRADGPDLPWRHLLGTEPEPRGDVRCAVVPDGPVYHRRVMRDLVVMGIRGATGVVRLTTPYFAPDRRVLRAMGVAAARGIRVELLLAGRSDHPVLRRAAHAYLPRLLATGVRVWEHETSMLHAKTAVFDERWAIVGTSNLDRQSFQHSYEVNLIIDGGSTPSELHVAFESDLGCAIPIDESALAARSSIERLLDRLSALVLHAI